MFSWIYRAGSVKPARTPTFGDDIVTGVSVSAKELIQLRLKAGSIKLENCRQVASSTAGIHPSRFRGRGIDYQESRSYQPGDDIRNMDWRVTARAGRPHTKLYREERERPVILMLDLAPSMFFGTRIAFKSVIAARAAALIAWATVQNGDRIGALLFGCRQHHEVRPMGGRRGALRLIRELVAWTEPHNDTAVSIPEGLGLGEALHRLRRVARPGSLILILSDFYSLDQDTEYYLTRLRQHNDVLACQISDILELVPPPPGHYSITDGHRTGMLDTSSPILRHNYKAYFAAQHEQVRKLMRKRAIPLLHLTTHEDVVDRLKRGLANPLQSVSVNQEVGP